MSIDPSKEFADKLWKLTDDFVDVSEDGDEVAVSGEADPHVVGDHGGEEH